MPVNYFLYYCYTSQTHVGCNVNRHHIQSCVALECNVSAYNQLVLAHCTMDKDVALPLHDAAHESLPCNIRYRHYRHNLSNMTNLWVVVIQHTIV